MKEKMKKFFTLTKRDNAGFTLVELIVVIAILAILAGVGTVGYSAYVKKANQSADRTLVSDVEQAVILHGYANSGSLQAGSLGYIILSEGTPVVNVSGVSTLTDGETAPNFLETALSKAFGDNWATSLKLSYTDWNAASALSQLDAVAVTNSSYVAAGTDKMMGDVQHCTGSFAEYLVTTLKNKDFTGEQGAALIDGFLGGTTVQDYVASSGYTGDAVDATVLANATVFGIAATMTEETKEEVISRFHSGYYIFNAESNLNVTNSNVLTETAHTYAALEALVSFLDDATVTEWFNEISLDGNKSIILRSIINTCDKIVGYVQTNGTAAYKYAEYYNLLDGSAIGTPASSQAMIDGQAYAAILKTVNDKSGDFGSSLSENEMFTSGVAKEAVDNLVNEAGQLAELASAVGAAVGELESYVALLFTVDARGNISCTTCPAMD